jgi:hypothetical protein
MLGLVLALAAGCGSATGTNVGGGAQSPIVGSWLSEGADVAPLLANAPFNWTKITADFKADGTYVVTGLDKSNKLTTFTGTYQDMPSEVDGILDITVTQVMPANTLAVGIYAIDAPGTHMQYEVVQTQPTNGLEPPTAAAGFGSSVYNGKKIATLIQKFSKQ